MHIFVSRIEGPPRFKVRPGMGRLDVQIGG